MTGLVPLPSLIRASAQDAGNASMRKANRAKWSEDDYNAACETQERLVRACYGRDGENETDTCFVRFQIAEKWERAGKIGLKSDWSQIAAEIDAEVAL